MGFKMGKKILVIDDEEVIRIVLTIHLGSAGYKVVCAETGSNGLKLALSDVFNLIITDFKLPDMNGLEIIKAIKAQKPDVPVMMMSGLIDDELIKEVKSHGAIEYIKKPFLKETILTAIANILSKEKDTAGND